MASAPPVSSGPRLGKLQGLRRDDEDDPQQKRRRPGKKGGIKILPLILMFVMFGPVVLTGLIFAFDYVATSEWGVKVGLSDDPRTRLTKFYKKHNPTKMRDVDKLLVKYKGKYDEMFKRLEAKYVGPDSRRKKQTEEEEEYVREQERYEREAREAQDKF